MRARGRERCANGVRPSFVVPPSRGDSEPEGTHMTTDTITRAVSQLAAGLHLSQNIQPGSRD
jgi:hypothetical protein